MLRAVLGRSCQLWRVLADAVGYGFDYHRTQVGDEDDGHERGTDLGDPAIAVGPVVHLPGCCVAVGGFVKAPNLDPSCGPELIN